MNTGIFVHATPGSDPGALISAKGVPDPGHKGSSNLYSLGKSPIDVKRLSTYLVSYPNRKIADELANGFKFGFKIPYTGPRSYIFCKNLKSADENKDQVYKKLIQEAELGRMAGPFQSLPIPNLRISPIGTVPKKDGGLRIITHLSYPQGNSVNSFIDPELASVQYSSFDQVVEIVSNLGKGALMGKMDIKSAFRLIPVSPSDFDLLGIQFNDQYFIDKCLPFGCSISCSVFEKFSTFLHWLTVQKCDLNTMEHYLDDFFFAGPPNTTQCHRLMSCFEAVCADLQVPLADDKKFGPVTSLTFLGLQIDTINMQVCVPQTKREELKQVLMTLSEKKKVTLRELQH